MSKRSQNCRDEKGRWEVAGGGLKWGFSAVDNLKREVKEEFDATAHDIKFMGYRDVFRTREDGVPTHWLMLDYAVRVDPKEVRLNEPDMADEIGWFTPDNLPTPLHSQQTAFMNKYHHEINKILRISNQSPPLLSNFI